MQRIILGLIAALFSLSAFAADGHMFPSALSTDSPNKDRKVLVVGVMDVRKPGTNAQVMTIEELTSNRKTIHSMFADGGMKLCEAVSENNPVCKSGGIIVSAEHNPSTVTVATLHRASGKVINVSDMPSKDFYGVKPAIQGSHGPTHLNCLFEDGRIKGTCRIANNE